MEELIFSVLKVFLTVFACIGIIFHLLVFRSPETGRKVEEKLGSGLGVQKEFIPWLEKNRMGLHEWLIKNKVYNVFAVIFLAILLILLSQI